MELIGALSIVRFRTSVKSPLELVIYFVLIVIEHKIEKNHKNFDQIPLTKIRFSKYCEAIKSLNIN